MARYESELSRLMAMFAPQGGYGIPNIGAFQGQLRSDSARALRAALGADQYNLQRGGLGQSVAGAFSGGTRRRQFSDDLLRSLMDLQQRHSQLGFQQRQQLMELLSPIAHERANRPSWLSTALGGILGLGAQVAIPGLGGMIFKDPLEKMMQQQNVWNSFAGGAPHIY